MGKRIRNWTNKAIISLILDQEFRSKSLTVSPWSRNSLWR